MSCISTDRIGPKHSNSIRIGPIATPVLDTDAVSKIYVDTFVVPTYVSPLTYNAGPNSVTIDEAAATTSGYISASTQTLGGNKTFTGALQGSSDLSSSLA